jgi:hypothetical protein
MLNEDGRAVGYVNRLAALRCDSRGNFEFDGECILGQPDPLFPPTLALQGYGAQAVAFSHDPPLGGPGICLSPTITVYVGVGRFAKSLINAKRSSLVGYLAVPSLK